MVYLSRNKQLTVPGLAAYLEEKLCFAFNLKSVYETKLRRMVIGNHPIGNHQCVTDPSPETHSCKTI